MRDPVALAYSGRIAEALEAALAQASSNDEFLAQQGLEALGVLGEQYGLRADEAIEGVLARRAAEGGVITRRAFEAATALGAQALEPFAIRRLERGDFAWDLLRYVDERPSHALGQALAAAWDAIPDRLRDQALLTSRVQPVANRAECEAWGRRVLAFTAHASDEIRQAAFVALFTWRPEEAHDACVRGLQDATKDVRVAAARALAQIDADRLAELVEELAGEFPELVAEVPLAARVRRTARRLERR